MLTIADMRDLHSVRKLQTDLQELYNFLETYAAATPEQIPELRRHLRVLKGHLFEIQEALDKYKEGVLERAQRQQKYREERIRGEAKG